MIVHTFLKTDDKSKNMTHNQYFSLILYFNFLFTVINLY